MSEIDEKLAMAEDGFQKVWSDLQALGVVIFVKAEGLLETHRFIRSVRHEFLKIAWIERWRTENAVGTHKTPAQQARELTADYQELNLEMTRALISDLKDKFGLP